MAIQIFAGESARKEIQRQGLLPERIKLMVGASGGPKWLMLSRLDQYICQHFLPKATQPMSLIGSSVGAWRMACYAQPDPLAAFKKFESLYMDQQYTRPMTPQAITVFVDKVLNALFDDDRAREIVNNKNRKLHVVAVRNRRLLSSQSGLMQALSLFTAATGNLISPKIVEALYPRVLISQKGSSEPYHFKPETIELSVDNLRQSLTASGAIPVVLEPSKITGGKDRLHWDGGMVDYHFSGPFNVDYGLVFYPHFFPKLIPGWFDKALPWRKIKAKNYSNVVMVTPSKKFISNLPFGKIPDRKDFTSMSDDERENYWHQVLVATDKLVEEFHEIMMKDGGASVVQPIERIL